MNTESSKSDRGLWLAWFLATVFGYGMGMLLGASLAYRLFDSGTFDATMGVTLGIVMGAVGGFAQWVVLRERFSGAGWWILASALGFAAFGLIGVFPSVQNPAVLGTLTSVTIGLVCGILQSLILRRKVGRAGWWVWANILGLLVGEFGFPVAIAISATTNSDVSVLVVGLVYGAGYGAVTGAALVSLLSQAHSGNIENMATAAGK